MTEVTHVDVAILGAGTAGLNARRAARDAGASVMMFDPGPFGTTCARVGCMPSKLLIAASDAAHHAREAHRFGVDVPEINVDGAAVLERVQRERDRFVSFVLDSIGHIDDKGELTRERATIVDAHTVTTASGATFKVRAIVLATGSSGVVPPPFRHLERHVLTSDSVFELPTLPKSLVVIGAGVIGMELGQAMHRLGVRVTVLGRKELLHLSDPKVFSTARTLFKAKLDLHLDYVLHGITEDDSGVTVDFDDDDGQRREVAFDRILFAAGRRANVVGVGLESLGLNPRALCINPRTGQIARSNIFVAGDATAYLPLLHEASDTGRIAGANAATFPKTQCFRRRAPLSVAFTGPQVAQVGMAFSSFDPEHHAVGEVDFTRQGRARVMGINEGMVRIYGLRSDGSLLGAEMVGPHMEHLGHLLAWAIQARLTVDDVLKMPFYHPTVEEGLQTALRDLQKDLCFDVCHGHVGEAATHHG